MNLKIKKVRDGYIIFDANGGGAHSHFKSRKAANDCLTLIKRKILPDRPYFVESCRRLLSEEDFNRLRPRKKKPKYININKGPRRR